MSCPDWNRLAAERRSREQAAAIEEPEGWREGLAHLEGCDGCRSEALAAEPLLVFRRLPAVEPDAATIDDMRAGVAALRRASRLTGGEAPPRAAARRASVRWWGRAAAAAVLAAGLLGLRPDARDAGPEPPEAWSLDAPAAIAQATGAPAFAVDDIEHPTASVYHFDDEELGVVMVVDAGLDV